MPLIYYIDPFVFPLKIYKMINGNDVIIHIWPNGIELLSTPISEWTVQE